MKKKICKREKRCKTHWRRCRWSFSSSSFVVHRVIVVVVQITRSLFEWWIVVVVVVKIKPNQLQARHCFAFSFGFCHWAAYTIRFCIVVVVAAVNIFAFVVCAFRIANWSVLPSFFGGLFVDLFIFGEEKCIRSCDLSFYFIFTSTNFELF